jgi:hypothetical protein
MLTSWCLHSGGGSCESSSEVWLSMLEGPTKNPFVSNFSRSSAGVVEEPCEDMANGNSDSDFPCDESEKTQGLG